MRFKLHWPEKNVCCAGAGAATLLIIFFIGALQGILTAATSTDLIIIYSNNTNGILENCQCPEHAYGALEKRAALIDSLRRTSKNVLLLDSGDLLDIRKNKMLHSYIVQAYKIMNYNAWTCGDQDFMEGPDFFRSLTGDLKFSPLLSTNITEVRSGNSVGQRYLIKQYGTLRVGITATINPEVHTYLEKESAAQYVFGDQKKSLRSVLAAMKPNCDFIILISHSGYEQDKKLAAWFPQINVIVGGHSQTIITGNCQAGQTCIVQCGENGYRLGILEVHFDDNKPASMDNKLILLDSARGNSPAVMELINAYHQQLKQKKH